MIALALYNIHMVVQIGYLKFKSQLLMNETSICLPLFCCYSIFIKMPFGVFLYTPNEVNVTYFGSDDTFYVHNVASNV